MSFLKSKIGRMCSPQHSKKNLPGGDRWVGGGEGESYDGLYDEAPPERGTFPRLQVNHRVGVSLVEVYERVGKSVIMVCERN